MKTFFLLILVATLGTFIFLRFQLSGDPNSDFNQTSRYKIGEYSFLRTLFGLHNDGDAREWYLSGTGPIDIEVVEANDTAIDDKALNNFAESVKQYTGRDAVIYKTSKIKSGTLYPADLTYINSSYRHRVATGDTNLFVIYADDFQKQGTEVAETYNETVIVLSDQRLREVTRSAPAEALTQFVESTLLHEFGHQLGLDHNDQPECIMNAKVESPDIIGAQFTGEYTPVKFCDFELNQLERIKSAF